MMKILILSLLMLASAAGASAQDDDNWVRPSAADYPTVPSAGSTIADFVPSGFEIVKTATGDLNADGVPDAAIHIIGRSKKFQNANEGLGSDVYDTNPRILLILLKDNTGYRLAEQSNTFIVPPDSPVSSEPFQDMSIRNGVLEIDLELWQSAGGWGMTNASYKFRYRGGEFQLIGAERRDAQRNTGEMEERSYNFLNNRVKITKGNFTNDGKGKTSWKNLPKSGIKTLKTFRVPFEWEIERDTFI